MRSFLCVAAAVLPGLLVPAHAAPGHKSAAPGMVAPADTGSKSALHEAGIEWCATHERFEAKFPNFWKDASCFEGTCDSPATRDASIPGGATPFKTIHLVFHVFANDDGSDAAASPSDVRAQLEQLNADFLPSRVQFTYETNYINNSALRFFDLTEEAIMKNTHAVNPAENLNVYVVQVLDGFLGVGTFPWDPDALGNLGGIIMHDAAFGAGEKTLTHEVGHNLGLWHTHHGVSEVPVCTACYETADGVDGDVSGDFCSDTAPTPTNFTCGDPAGEDTCTDLGWGDTDTQNYMGYAPDSCISEFSTQQMGRMHCWGEDILAGWFRPEGAGYVLLDRVRYSCSDMLEVAVVDTDLDGQLSAAVTLTTSGGDAETVTLLPEGSQPGKFMGGLSTDGAAILAGDGSLNVSGRDTITATYNDLSDGADLPGVDAFAAEVDCTPPIIFNVETTYVGGRTVTVQFNTEDPTTGEVSAGSSCGTVEFTATSGSGTTHLVTLEGLQPQTSYAFSVAAVDAASNAAVDNNGGACYTFTTTRVPDIYTESFGTTPDLAFNSLTFTPDDSADGYGVCSEAVSELFVAPSGGSAFAMGDDDSQLVTLSGGQSVLLHGEAYTAFHINSNGSITFDAPDSFPVPNFGGYFNAPRIAPLWFDLDPSEGGTMYREQLADRYVVTWQQVPEWSQTDSTTMQLELFFAGGIRMTYLEVEADSGVSGLSEGIGLTVVEEYNDFTASIDCALFESVEFLPFVTGPYWAETGQSATLYARSSGLGPDIDYAWTFNGASVPVTGEAYTIEAVGPGDEGWYGATLTTPDTKEIFVADPFYLRVVAAGSLPAAGGVGLASAAAALIGCAWLRRRRG